MNPSQWMETILSKLKERRAHYDQESKAQKGDNDYWIAKRIAYAELAIALEKIIKEVEQA